MVSGSVSKHDRENVETRWTLTAYAFWKLKIKSSSHTCASVSPQVRCGCHPTQSDRPDSHVDDDNVIQIADSTHIAKIPVEHLDIPVDDLECDELVVVW